MRERVLEGWRTAFGLALLIIYLVANTISGRDGLASFVALQARERALEADLAKLEARREVLAEQVRRLAGARRDLDAVEELARRHLNAVRPDEVVILMGAPA